MSDSKEESGVLRTTLGNPILSRDLRSPETMQWLFGSREPRSMDDIRAALRAFQRRTGKTVWFADFATNEPAMIFLEEKEKRPNAPRRRVKVYRPPATGLVTMLGAIYSQRTFDRVFGQIITDMRIEYFDALQAGQLGLARWRHIQLYLTLVMTTGALVGAKFGRLIEKVWKAVGPA
jgi:hypothetical protein